MRELRLNVTSDPAHLAPVRRAVEAFCAACGFVNASICEVGLCVNEAMANITSHAYEGATDRPVLIGAHFDNNTLELTLRDWGSGCDPSQVPTKRDPLAPGGLGMVCLRKLMDDVSYEPQPDGMLLTLRKRRLGG